MEFLFIDHLPFETPLRWFILKVKIAFALSLCVLRLHRLPDDAEISTPESPCLPQNLATATMVIKVAPRENKIPLPAICL